MRYPLFDWLRLFLALEVVFWHLSVIPGAIPPPYKPDPLPAVPCFLAISGFMILRSWQSSDSGLVFWIKRLFRIMPAFLASLGLVWVLLGSWRMYQAFVMWGTLGFSGSENGPLWSLGCEEILYGLLSLACWRGLVKPKETWLLATSSSLLVLAWSFLWFPEDVNPWLRYAVLPPAFLTGIAFSQAPVKWHWKWTALVTLACYVPVFFAPSIKPLLTIPASILVLQLGTLPVRSVKWVDVSYAVYIYHMPILHWLMGFKLATPTLWVATLLLTAGASWLSYVAIEAPAMRLRNRLLGRLRLRRSDPQPVPVGSSTPIAQPVSA